MLWTNPGKALKILRAVFSQMHKLLELERLFKEQVRIVRRAEKAQDRIRFRIFSCQNRHEEAVRSKQLAGCLAVWLSACVPVYLPSWLAGCLPAWLTD
jgi:hypothetical protein